MVGMVEREVVPVETTAGGKREVEGGVGGV
jgi:hypothetical protein